MEKPPMNILLDSDDDDDSDSYSYSDSDSDDPTGPMIQVVALFEMFSGKNVEASNKPLVDLHAYPTEYLATLALATGYAQRFPHLMARFLVYISPRRFLESETQTLALQILRDDESLLEHHYHTYHCEGLTNAEVMEACLLRGMPVSVDCNTMRKSMTNHLKLVERVLEKFPVATTATTEEEKQRMALFIMHLPALRQYFKNSRK
mmetsp:Transcript_21370/g.49308  ORF Transcript_21370/g.49308 Transcript_21370/m.49308 type:complete len:205 (+) Transcript_21370:1-615(+)